MDHFKDHWLADLQQHVLNAVEETICLFSLYCINLRLININNSFFISSKGDTLKYCQYLDGHNKVPSDMTVVQWWGVSR